MAFTEQDVTALKRAIATGALKARLSNGEEVTYRSLAEMRSTLAMMQAEVQGTVPGALYVMQPNLTRGL